MGIYTYDLHYIMPLFLYILSFAPLTLIINDLYSNFWSSEYDLFMYILFMNSPVWTVANKHEQSYAYICEFNF